VSCCIYALYFQGSRHRYVGSTKNLKNRLAAHRSLLKSGKHACRALQRAFDKYGLDALIVSTLETVERLEDLIALEQKWIDTFGHAGLYNRLLVAAPRPQAARAAEIGKKVSAGLMGNQYRRGILHDEETKARISASLKRRYAEGRKVTSGDRFRELHRRVAVGEIDRPWQYRSKEQVFHILTALAQFNSFPIAARHLGMTAANIKAVVKKSGQSLVDTGHFKRPPKNARRAIIHPEWIDHAMELYE
jgi:group I intron endonuclease